VARNSLTRSERERERERERAGSVDPFDVANFLSTQNADLDRSYLAAIKRTERVNGISERIIRYSLPFFLLVGVFPVHRILAPRGTPLKTTERPYFLISGFGMLLTAALTMVVLIPVHYAALNSASLGIPRPAWDPTGSAAVSSLLIIFESSPSI
jgi:hypothetical protein